MVNRAIHLKDSWVGGPTTTWNPSDKHAGITLSSANLAAADNLNDGANHGVRAVASHSAGLYYCEFHVDTLVSRFDVGIANATEVLILSASFLIGSSNNSIGFDESSIVNLNNSGVGAVVVFATGDTISMAVDMGNKTIWFRVNAGNWNNSGTANPATNAGGFSFSTMNAGPWFPMFAGRNLDKVTANFGATAYAQSVPAGFGNW